MFLSFRKKKADDGLLKLTPADLLIAAEKKLSAQQKEVLDSYRNSLKINPSIETALAHAVVTMGGANIKDASFLYPFIAADLKATSMFLDLQTALASLGKIPVATCLSATKVLFGLVHHINQTKDLSKINDLTVRIPVVLKKNAAEQFSAELKGFFASLPKGLSSMTLELTLDDNAAALSDEAIKAMLNAAGNRQIDLSLKNVRFSQDQYETEYVNKWHAASHSEEKVSLTRNGLIHDNCLMRRTSWNGQEIASSSPSAESRAMKQQ